MRIALVNSSIEAILNLVREVRKMEPFTEQTEGQSVTSNILLNLQTLTKTIEGACLKQDA